MDELDNLIRWALRERVAGVSISPHVWERIKERLERPAVRSLMGLRSSKAYRVILARLARVDAFLSAQVASWMWPENRWMEWRRAPCSTCLLDQYGFLPQLAF